MDKRVLIYLPIIHTPKDMGDLNDSIRQAAVKLLGMQSLKKEIIPQDCSGFGFVYKAHPPVPGYMPVDVTL